MKKTWLSAIIIYVALIVVCAFAVYAVPSIRGFMEKTYIAEQGEIKLSDEVELRFDREEKTYYAKCNGEIEKLAKQGKLYKAGTKIIDFTDTSGQARTESCYSKKPGYVVYLSRKRKYTSGDAIYKIVKNTKWHMKFDIEPDRAKNYFEGATVYIKIDGEDIKAVVDSVKKKKKYSRVTLSCGVLFKGCLKKDKIKAEIIVAKASGLVLRNDSIIKKNGKKGVIVKNKMGDYIFKPISIKANDGKECVVYQDLFMDKNYNFVETISIYDEIIDKPSKEDIKQSE